MTEELTKINENLSLDRKDACLIYEDEDFFLVTIIILECVERVYQHPSFNDILKFFPNTDSLISTRLVLRTLRKVYDEFKITNYNLYINHYDKYRKRIDTEVETEKDPVEKAKKEEIIADFLDLDPYIGSSKTEKNRHIIDRDRFTLYAKQFRAFNYLRDDIVVFLDLIPSFFDIDDFNRKLKHIFDNLNAISASQEIRCGEIVFEVGESRKILAELSGGQDAFKIPFTKVGTLRRANLIRLMKYWELKGLVIVDDWLGDDGGWNIKLLSKLIIDPIQDFLNSIDNIRTYLDENILETRMEQELLAKMRGFDYTSVTSDAIFLGKIKRLKATPQSIWSLGSSRGYSTHISEAILEWESVLKYCTRGLQEKKVVTKNNRIDKENVILKKQNNVKKPSEGFSFDSETGVALFNGVKIGKVTVGTMPFKLIYFLSKEKGKIYTYKEIKNHINPLSVEDTDEKYCQKKKSELPKGIKKYIASCGKGVGYRIVTK